MLHVVTRFIDGAGGNTLLSALGTDPHRYEVWVTGGPGGPLWERAEEAGIRTVVLDRFREVLSPGDDFRVLVALVRLIRRERFTVVHTHSSKGGFLGRLAAWLCRTPVVVHTIHGFAVHPFMSPSRRRSYLALERLVRPMTDAFIAVAPQVAREAVELGLAPPGAIRVVPSAVEFDEIPRAPDRAARASVGVPEDVPLVGTVGRLDFQKAPLDFVRMAAQVARSHPQARFVWIGQGGLLEEAQEEARRLGVSITFAGFRRDAARIAASFDVYVVSSRHEGLGRALTEAMASGRPVVATNVNGVVDLVEPGATGLLSEPEQPEALARNVAWMLDHPEEARQMAEAGRARVRVLFRPRVMCGLIEQTYDRLLGLPTPETHGGAPHL
ncbi:MAG TPA: glycosyltransferase family 4 protein [Solirubrobacteraceae bacterium]|nr:glycosyltransferase family 4 protein [Solirubrobacteraceae bacterium]